MNEERNDTMTNDEIIKIASLAVALDQSPDDETTKARLEAVFDRMQGADGMLMVLAYKLLAGSPYGIVTDNPENARRARSIAADIGAAIEEVEAGELEGPFSLASNPDSVCLRFTAPGRH